MRRLPMLLVLLCSQAAVAGRQPVESWSKPGVAFDRYRVDSVECGIHGYLRDVSVDDTAIRFLRGFRSADDALNRSGGMNDAEWQNAIRRTQPDRRLRELQAIQVGDVEQCLVARGYRKFRLNRDEENTLARYARGSEDRRRYLHALASTPRSD